ncbi:elongation factor P maturation arginine rhamnosyltransferase EarP [Chitinibacter sp. SCUT-21]|uniref:elongation factor P maturation arginine rhamnosyltransferase EarP n=1 Tax=Chitinibacter sp. SCUT-21 TaxID=2970891 RepID=UPI0035A6EEFE
MMTGNWAIFCRVVDNFGDIGVCWRLARQLANEFALDVTLWVDDLASFAQIRPEVNPQLAQQTLENVTIKHWPNDFPADEIAADVVLEAFACEIPAAYLVQMKARAISPVWINLEYLSAEPWVEGCHGLPSPVQGLNKYFFFPGFSPKTGGVFSEQQQRQLQLSWNQTHSEQFLAKLVPQLATRRMDDLVISLFAYEPAALHDWLHSLSLQSHTTHLIVPEGRVLRAMNLSESSSWQCIAGVCQQGAVKVYPLPMLSQDDYDRLLLSCDLNFVRGEDSFLRAQWAAKPFVWHIYPQDDNAHQDKLDAFLALYLRGLAPEAAQAGEQMMQVWNHGGDIVSAWSALLAQRDALQQHAEQWRKNLIELGDLATNLVRFVNSKVK